MIQTRKTILMVILAVLIMSCNENTKELDILNEPPQSIIKQKNGVLKFNTKEELAELVEKIKEIGAESFYNKEIKKLVKEGYEPLRPYFLENETEELESFIEKKRKKIEKYKDRKNNGNIEFDLEDDIIVDSSFEVLFNFQREIIVANKLYQYTKDGIYSVDEDKIIDFHNFIEKKSKNTEMSAKNSINSFSELGVDFIPMDFRSELTDDKDFLQKRATTRSTNIQQQKLNFKTIVFKKKHTWVGKKIGYSKYAYDYAPNGRRV